MSRLLKYKLFEAEYREGNDDIAPEAQGEDQNETPFLNEYGKDLTKMASDGKLDPVVGRKKEIYEASWILSRRKKNNPVLIGEAGVGKTAIVEGIAQLIADEKCPRTLIGKRVISIDIPGLLAGASFKGQFEQRIKIMLKEIEAHPEIILFIDEIHLISSGSNESSMGNILKPALARGEIRCVGATTLDEYRNSIEKDRALERRFQKIIVEQTNVEETYEILKNIKGNYEDFHLVEYTDDALMACVKLADKYFTDRFFPDKAIDLMDESGARAHLDDSNVPESILNLEEQIHQLRENKVNLINKGEYEQAAAIRVQERQLIAKLEEEKRLFEEENENNRIVITKEDVANVVSHKTNIPVGNMTGEETARYINMPTELKMSIIGQDEAIDKISRCVKRNKAGMKDPKKPAGVFLFLGPTGVGKTETVKQLAKFIFGSEDSLLRFDMSEYQQEHEVARMKGSPPGYVGYGEGGQLTEKVRRKPYSIILLDEFEKAHKKIQEVFLQVFDDGIMTDGSGRKVDFKNTIIIMTSNIGSKLISKKASKPSLGFVKADEKEKDVDNKKIIKNELNKHFSPEFLNRIDDIIIFKSLNKENIFSIIDIIMRDVVKRLSEKEINLIITDNFKELLLEKGWDENMGARPLKRAIQRYIEDPLTDEILKGELSGNVTMDYNKENGKVLINGNPVEIFTDLTEKLITKFQRFNEEYDANTIKRYKKFKRRRLITYRIK